MPKPLILVDPFPRTLDLIFRPEARARLETLAELVVHEDGPAPDALVEAHLDRVDIVLGQTPFDAARLARAPRLRAIVNVETNFTDDLDYAACFARGVHVLTPGSAFAGAVAEAALGMAIDLARGITAADRAMRAGTEAYGLEGNAGAFRFAGSTVGILGYGDLGRAFHALLAPFGCEVLVHDPWVPDYLVARAGAAPVDLDTLLSSARTIAIFAGVTAENAGFLDRAKLGLIRSGAAVLLMSRAAVVDFDAFVDLVRAGRFRAATDVFPVEPVAPDDPVRQVEGLLLSAHRTGGMPDALLDIGDQTLADVELILRGLPPMVCRRAQRETVGRMRSKPVTRT
jgi:phosphoglycerate dehydrogenase-like enzyme